MKDLWGIYLLAVSNSDHHYRCYGNTKNVIFVRFAQSLASVAILHNGKTPLNILINIHNLKNMTHSDKRSERKQEVQQPKNESVNFISKSTEYDHLY